MVAVGTPGITATRTRAAAMPPEERRAAILAATVPLLMAHGTEITSRQIAEAAGVAEGTIFRVFADKESLLDAAIELAFDVAPLAADLRAIDRAAPLGARCVEAVEILQTRFASLWRILGALDREPDERPATDASERNAAIIDALATVFEPDRARLRVAPRDAAIVLRGLTIGSTHPALMGDDPLSPEAIASVVLDGIRTLPDGEPTC